jgi:hypothetical protein
MREAARALDAGRDASLRRTVVEVTMHGSRRGARPGLRTLSNAARAAAALEDHDA